MRTYHSERGYDGTGKAELKTMRIEDIKRSPLVGHTRAVVREDGKRSTYAVVDIPLEMAKKAELKEKGKYRMKVAEKDWCKQEGHQTNRVARAGGFTAYTCVEKPEAYVPGSEHKDVMNRFGGANVKNVGRIKF
jgi:nucleoside-triphosphatase THEP1